MSKMGENSAGFGVIVYMKKNVIIVSLFAMFSAVNSHAEIASKAWVESAIEPVDTKVDNHIANKYGTTAAEVSGYATVLENATTKYQTYPTMAMTDQMIEDAQSVKIDGTVYNDRNSVMVRNSSGAYVKGTGTDISVNDGAITVNHATKATQDNDGNTITDTYATKALVGTPNWNSAPSTVFNISQWVESLEDSKQNNLSVLSTSEGRTGTAETARSINAKNLKEIVQGDSTTAGLAPGAVLNGYTVASSASNVAATDTIQAAIGKLEKKADEPWKQVSAALMIQPMRSTLRI